MQHWIAPQYEPRNISVSGSLKSYADIFFPFSRRLEWKKGFGQASTNDLIKATLYV